MITHNEQGRTMLEMLGVIAIMGVIVYGAIAGINYGMTSYKINQTYTEVQNITQGIQDLYSWSRGYPSASRLMEAACKNDIFSMGCDTNNKAPSQFGNITLNQAGVNLGNGLTSNFSVTILIPNESDRERLESMDWGAINIEAPEQTGGGLTFKPL